MSYSETIKANIHYGGLMEYKDKKFSYRGGLVKKGMVIDPDYMTWSIFDEFCEKNGSQGIVEEVWYKLPHEDVASARQIYQDKDAEIRKLCSEAMSTEEVDIYIEHGVSIPIIELVGDGNEVDETEEVGDGYEAAEAEEVGAGNVSVEEEEEEEEEEEAINEAVQKEGHVEEEEGEEIEEEAVDEAQFQTFFGSDLGGNEEDVEVNDSDQREAEDVDDDAAQRETEDADDDECEFERQCHDAVHPDPALDTDDEWEALNREERHASRTNYSKEKPPYLWLMQTFNSGEEFKEQLLRYVLKTNYDIKLCRWEKTKLGAVCTKEKCTWKIYCSVEKPKGGKWMVKMYSDSHNHLKTGKARMLKQGTVGMLFKDEARRRPSLKWTEIKDEIMMRYNISVSKWICIKARRIALDMIIETQKQQFAKLWDYEAELIRSNPGTTTEVVTIPKEDGRQVFDRFYICFKVLRDSWKRSSRPIIGLDGSFMKWELKGEILAAVGRDADNRIYPIAWAIVRVEDNDSWAWFVEKLKTDLDLGLGNGVSVISDKQKGLINAVADILPNAEHRHCARHILANWKKSYGQMEYENFFWSVAFSPCLGEYQHHMEELKEYDESAYESLLRTEPKTWCRAFFSKNGRCEDVCNNLSESFNRTIKEARKLPMINMLEEIRRLAMKRISRRYDKALKCKTKFPPNIMKIYEKNRKDSKFCSVIKSSATLYEVIEQEGSYEVCLPYKHCACNQWDVTGIPCRHAIHVISDLNHDPDDYVDAYYLTTNWQANYRDNIRPVNGERLWPRTGKESVQVPEKRRMPGRPKKHARMKEAHESSSNPTKVTRHGRTVTCSNCKQTGHNCGTCTSPKAASGPKRKRGRPRKFPDDPWSIQNAPRRQRLAQSQSTPSPSSACDTLHDPYPSSAPPAPSSAPPAPSRVPPATSSARTTSGRGRGRPPGRGRGRGRDIPPPLPRGGCFISPWTGRVFDRWTSSDVRAPRNP